MKEVADSISNTPQNSQKSELFHVIIIIGGVWSENLENRFWHLIHYPVLCGLLSNLLCPNWSHPVWGGRDVHRRRLICFDHAPGGRHRLPGHQQRQQRRGHRPGDYFSVGSHRWLPVCRDLWRLDRMVYLVSDLHVCVSVFHRLAPGGPGLLQAGNTGSRRAPSTRPNHVRALKESRTGKEPQEARGDGR